MKIDWPQPNRIPGVIDALGFSGLVGLLIARFIPVAKWIPFWGCPLRQTTGWPCPACGLTRVADRVAHFNLPGAWQANPLGTVAALLFALAAVLTLLHLALKMPLPEVTLTAREAQVVRALVVLAAVVNYAFVVVQAKFPQLL
jgi:hypothetical protein